MRNGSLLVRNIIPSFCGAWMQLSDVLRSLGPIHVHTVEHAIVDQDRHVLVHAQMDIREPHARWMHAREIADALFGYTNHLQCLRRAGTCQNGGTCQRLPRGQFRCNCADGFEGDHCDTNICSSSPCQHGGTCNPTPGKPDVCDS